MSHIYGRNTIAIL